MKPFQNTILEYSGKQTVHPSIKAHGQKQCKLFSRNAKREQRCGPLTTLLESEYTSQFVYSLKTKSSVTKRNTERDCTYH